MNRTRLLSKWMSLVVVHWSPHLSLAFCIGRRSYQQPNLSSFTPARSFYQSSSAQLEAVSVSEEESISTVHTSSAENNNEDWVSLLPPRYSGQISVASDPFFQAFCQGQTPFYCTINAIPNGSTLSVIQQDARLLQALNFGYSASVVSGTPGVRQGVSQVWLQVPKTADIQSSSHRLSPLLTGHLEGRAQLERFVEALRRELEEQQGGATTVRERWPSCLPPDQVEFSYLYYDGTTGGYYDKHIDTPRRKEKVTGQQRQRERCVSFLLYLGGKTNAEWDVEQDGGQLRVYLTEDQLMGVSRSATSDDVTRQLLQPAGVDPETELAYVDIIPAAGTLVLFDSATILHEVCPTHRDRLAVVGWFGTNSI